MSSSCDHRIMLERSEDGKGKPNVIGLNETKLGIIAPFWFKVRRGFWVSFVSGIIEHKSVGWFWFLSDLVGATCVSNLSVAYYVCWRTCPECRLSFPDPYILPFDHIA